MTPHLAAVLAGRNTVEEFPDEDGPIVLQLVARSAILSIALDNIDGALAMARAVAPVSATEGIILVADAYHQSVEVEQAPTIEQIPPRGELAERFRHGDPSVTEALLIHSAWRDGRFDLTVCPYRRDDHGIEWLSGYDHDSDDEEVEGRVPDELRSYLATGLIFEEVTENWAVEGVMLATVTYLLQTMGMAADLIEREPDGDVDVRTVPDA